MTAHHSPEYWHPCPVILADGQPCNVHYRVAWSGSNPTRHPHEHRSAGTPTRETPPQCPGPTPGEHAAYITFHTQGVLL